MKYFFQQHKLLIIAFLILVAMVLTAWFGVRPLYLKVLALRNLVQEEIVRQENQQKQIKRLPELKSQYERVVGEERFFDILLTEDKVVGFIRILEGLAGETKVAVKIQSNETKVEEVVKKKSSNKDSTAEGDEAKGEEEKPKTLANLIPYGEYIRLTLTVTGDYTNIVAFVSRLETLPVALDVLGIEIRQPLRDDNSREGDVRAVNPFAAVESVSSDASTNPDGSKADTISAELTKPLSPKLEAVIDLVVYVDKKE